MSTLTDPIDTEPARPSLDHRHRQALAIIATLLRNGGAIRAVDEGGPRWDLGGDVVVETFREISEGRLDVVIETYPHSDGVHPDRVTVRLDSQTTVADAVRSVISDVLRHGPALSDIDDDDLAERLRTAGLDPHALVPNRGRL